MRLILLDQNVPVGLRQLLRSCEVHTAFRMGWAAFSNGQLLAAAEAAGFDVIIRCDQNLAYQQNLSERQIAILVLSTNRWAVIKAHGREIEHAVSTITSGSLARLALLASTAITGLLHLLWQKPINFVH